MSWNDKEEIFVSFAGNETENTSHETIILLKYLGLNMQAAIKAVTNHNKSIPYY